MGPEQNTVAQHEVREGNEPDYDAIGREMLRGMGIDDPSFGDIAVSAGDDEGKCVGTMAEAVARHEMVRGSLTEIAEDARSKGVSVEKEMMEDRTFKRFLIRDEETGEIAKVMSPEDLKKN